MGQGDLDQLQRKAKVRLPGFEGWFMEKSLHSFLAALSLSALGNVILALVNGSKHIPYK